MGQQEVIDVLKKSDKPLNRSQIAKELGISESVVSKILGRMLKYKDIECIELDRYDTARLLNWDAPWRRSRFYYISKEG